MCTPASTAPTCAQRVEADPDAELLVHPECGCATSALYLVGAGAVPAERVKVLSTGGMLEQARRTTADRVLVATETGMLHQLRQANPGTDFAAVNDRAVCRFMKMITAEKLLHTLRAGEFEVTISGDIADRARGAVEAHGVDRVAIGGWRMTGRARRPAGRARADVDPQCRRRGRRVGGGRSRGRAAAGPRRAAGRRGEQVGPDGGQYDLGAGRCRDRGGHR